ncbi:helix-turn-helix transcriptional regulator [bacterium]|nr:helix-turn-helix transcriptional regulator [bacterium]
MNIRALGLNIRAERNRKELSQEQLAELVDLSSNSILQIEKGRQIPNAINLYLIAKVLKVDINELYKGIED